MTTRIVVVSTSDDRARELAAALANLATVGVAASVAAAAALGTANLWVVDLGDLTSPVAGLAEAPASMPVIVVIPSANVVSVVELMQTSPQIAGMVVVDDADTTELRAMAARVVADDVFGLDKVMAPGTQVHTFSVADYAQKTACMSAIAAHFAELGIPRAYEPIEQCIDEMIMNALYTAPVDAKGKHVFADVPTRQRILMRTRETVTVQIAADAKRFAVGVRDAFGTLQQSTVMRHLYKAVYARDAVDRKAGGAGLGIYLMASSTAGLFFNVLPGIATEAICTFDRGATRQLEQFGFFTQRDARGLVAARPARRQYAKPRYKLWGSLAAGVTVAVAAAVIVPRLLATPPTAQIDVTTTPVGATVELDGRPMGIASTGTLSLPDLEPGQRYRVAATIEGYERQEQTVDAREGTLPLVIALKPLARVELESTPPGATIEVDGVAMGSTPLVLTSLPPSKTVTISYKRLGYVTASRPVEVPPAGEVRQVTQILERSPDFVRITIASSPRGAEILRPGQVSGIDRIYAPAEVFVEVGKPQRFELTMHGHATTTLELTPTREDEGTEKTATLLPK